MASRSRRGGRSRRRRPSGWLPRLASLAFFALLALLLWQAWRTRERPSMEDRVLEMIRENPSAEVLAPGPSGAASEDVPEVFRVQETAPGAKKH